MHIADAAFFDCDPPDLARRLIGQTLVSTLGGARVAGRIVETEVYLRNGDAAAHSARGLTAATRTLFGPPGRLYVHPMRQHCGADIVARGGSVLLRALEPVDGVDTMRLRRGTDRPRLLAGGPARLCAALGITRALDGLDLGAAEASLHIALTSGATPVIGVGPRIGLTKAADLPLRFTLSGSPYLSRREAAAQKNA